MKKFKQFMKGGAVSEFSIPPLPSGVKWKRMKKGESYDLEYLAIGKYSDIEVGFTWAPDQPDVVGWSEYERGKSIDGASGVDGIWKSQAEFKKYLKYIVDMHFSGNEY